MSVNWRWLAVLGVVAFLVGLVFTVPAALLYTWIQPKDTAVQVVGLQGTLREGSFAGVVNKNRTVLGAMHWQLRPLWLLLGRAALRVDGGGDDMLIDGEIAWLPTGTVKLGEFRANAGLKQLLGSLGYAYLPVDGKAALNFKRFALRDGVPVKAEGNGVVQGLAWTLARDPMLLGDFQADVVTQDEAIVATLSSIGGPLDLKGEARLLPDGSYETSVQLKAKPEASPALRNLISSLGAPDLQGYQQLKRVGQLKPKPPAGAKPPPPPDTQ